MREIGTPLMVTAAEYEEVHAHVKALNDRGMSCQGIADTCPTPMHDTTVAKVLHRWTNKIHRDTYTALMLTTYAEPTGWRHGKRVDSTGVRRRMQALVADGFGYNVLGDFMGISLQAVYQLATRDAPTFASTYSYVVPVYEKLAGKDPRAYGATKLGVSRALGTARRHDWAPSHTWDSDTIDNPDAFPEWTGECGTVTGYNLHRKERIHVLPSVDKNGKERLSVLCKPCCHARIARKDEIEAQQSSNRDKCRQMLEDGQTMRYISDVLGMSTRTVQRVKKEMESA
jgi:hypothetical protein